MTRWCSDMAQASTQKFTFGDDFEHERRGGTMRRAQDRAALDEAEQRGYAAGFAAGQAAQQAGDEAQLAAAFHAIAMRLSSFDESLKRFLAICEEEAVALAVSLAELHGDCVAGFDPRAGFAQAAHDVLAQFPDAGRVLARVPAPLRAAAEERLARLADEMRFSGRLVVEPLSDAMGDADFSFEWNEGALRHDRQALRASLTDEFQRFGFALTDVNDHG